MKRESNVFERLSASVKNLKGEGKKMRKDQSLSRFTLSTETATHLKVAKSTENLQSGRLIKK